MTKLTTPLAIVVLNQDSVPLGRQIASLFPEATIYGLESRTSEVDVSFADFGDTVRGLFSQGIAIIGICAAGILIRTVAPLLTNKWQEPPLLAVAPDGSAVVPLLGGLQGVNELATTIAEILQVAPAITTTGKLRFDAALLNPPTGYHLGNPDMGKTFVADLLSGATVSLEGEAPWLQNSKLSFTAEGKLKIVVTEKAITPSADCLLYHPKTLAIGIDGSIASNPQEAIAIIEQLLSKAGLSPHSLAGVFALDTQAGDRLIHSLAYTFKIPARFFCANEISTETNIAEQIALYATKGQLIVTEENIAVAAASLPFDANEIGTARGKVAIVGTGPGGENWLSPEARELLNNSTDWVGYKTYLDLVDPLRKHQQRHESDNRVEIERAKFALDLAATGKTVAVISSGDPGIYAMAAAVFEALEQENKPQWQQLEIQVSPGISAMQAAAAMVGAPLGHDFCAISLSDILKPWSVIEDRLAAAAKADFVIAFYNPVSKQRTWQLEKAKEILLRLRSPQTPVVLARNLGRKGQKIVIKTLGELQKQDADMRTVILVGSSKTRTLSQGDSKLWVYTPRHYENC